MSSPEVSVILLCPHLAKFAPYGLSKLIPPAFFHFLSYFLEGERENFQVS